MSLGKTDCDGHTLRRRIQGLWGKGKQMQRGQKAESKSLREWWQRGGQKKKSRPDTPGNLSNAKQMRVRVPVKRL